MTRHRAALLAFAIGIAGVALAFGGRDNPGAAEQQRAFWHAVGGPLPAATESDLVPVPGVDPPTDSGPLAGGSAFAPPYALNMPRDPGGATNLESAW